MVSLSNHPYSLMFQLLQHSLQVCGKRGVELHVLTPDRVAKTQDVGMEELA